MKQNINKIQWSGTECVSYETVKQFKFHKANRNVNETSVKRFMKSMPDELEVFPPLMVNEKTMNVLDGQNRLSAYKRCIEEGKLPSNATIRVEYFDIPEDNELAIIKNLQNGKQWSNDDHISSCVKVSNPNYISLEQFCEGKDLLLYKGKTKRFNYRYAVAMLKGKNMSKELKDGTLSITMDDIEHGKAVYNEISKLIDTLDLPRKGSYIEDMAIVWTKVRPKRPFNEWVSLAKREKTKVMKLAHSSQGDWKMIFNMVNGAE